MTKLLNTLYNIIKEEVNSKDVHQAADSVGMKWDNNKKFMAFSKRITGKEHIDDMTSKEREELIKKILKEEHDGGFPAQEIIEYWQKELGITDWVITTERISPEQIDYNDATDFIGISRDFPNKTGIIYHDRDLYEEAIIHELVHVQQPTWSEDQVNAEMDRLMNEKPFKQTINESTTEYYNRLPKNIQQSIDKLRNNYNLKITDNHIQKEFEQEGNWRPDKGGVNKVAENQISKLINDVKLKFPNVSFPSRDIVSSYRSYDKQVINFGYKATKRGVDKTQISNTLPGFSQHHTGKAFDIFSVGLSFWNSNPKVKEWVLLNAPKYGFEVTYKTQGSLRIAEPWHLYYTV